MTNNTTKDQIIALFPDNADNEISAADMRVYVEAIFNDKEVTIVKLQRLIDMPSSNTNIYEGTLVLIWGDTFGVNGIYLSVVNQPTVETELMKIAGLTDSESNTNVAMTYDHTELVAPISLNTSDYTEILELTTPNRTSGKYELKLSMIASYDTPARAGYFRFSEDGGNTWAEMQEEPKDANNKIFHSFLKVDNFTGGIKNIIIEARCTTASDTLAIDYMMIAYQRVA